jgi:hypothetical protein
MMVCTPGIIAELDDRKQRHNLDVELNHPYLPIFVGSEVTIGDQKADDVGVVQGHDGTLEICSCGRPSYPGSAQISSQSISPSFTQANGDSKSMLRSIVQVVTVNEKRECAHVLLPGPPQQQWGMMLTNLTLLAPRGARIHGILDAKPVVVEFVVGDVVTGAAAAAHFSRDRYVAHLGSRLISHVAQQEALFVVDPA